VCPEGGGLARRTLHDVEHSFQFPQVPREGTKHAGQEACLGTLQRGREDKELMFDADSKEMKRRKETAQAR